MTTSDRFIAHMTHVEIAAAATARAVVVQPIGAVEQHGPHLPCGVDSMIATALVEAAMARLAPDVDVFVLPTLAYGKSNEHDGFAGTISLSTNTLYGLCLDVGRSVARWGFRKLAFVNAHGGQPQLLEVAARDIRAATDLQVFPIHAYRLPAMAAATARDAEWGVHAGETETALMLAIHPDTVRTDRLVAGGHAVRTSFEGRHILSLEGAVPTAWLTRDVSASGVIGDPAAATAAAGAALLAALADDLALAFGEIADFEFASD